MLSVASIWLMSDRCLRDRMSIMRWYRPHTLRHSATHTMTIQPNPERYIRFDKLKCVWFDGWPWQNIRISQQDKSQSFILDPTRFRSECTNERIFSRSVSVALIRHKFKRTKHTHRDKATLRFSFHLQCYPILLMKSPIIIK